MSYLAPERCLKLPHCLRSTRGPRSRHFFGSHVCHTWGGSTTWSSTLMILGSAMTSRVPENLTLASGKWVPWEPDPGSGGHPLGRTGSSNVRPTFDAWIAFRHEGDERAIGTCRHERNGPSLGQRPSTTNDACATCFKDSTPFGTSLFCDRRP